MTLAVGGTLNTTNLALENAHDWKNLFTIILVQFNSLHAGYFMKLSHFLLSADFFSKLTFKNFLHNYQS